MTVWNDGCWYTICSQSPLSRDAYDGVGVCMWLCFDVVHALESYTLRTSVAMVLSRGVRFCDRSYSSRAMGGILRLSNQLRDASHWSLVRRSSSPSQHGTSICGPSRVPPN